MLLALTPEERERFFDPDRHAHALSEIAVSRLREGRLEEAFRLADRRCRIGSVTAHDFVLRAEIARRRGFRDLSLSDLRRALDLDPEHRGANRRMLAWGEGDERKSAAWRLVETELDAAGRRAALDVLADGSLDGVGVLAPEGDALAGWIAWNGPARLGLTVETDTESHTVTAEADPEASDRAGPFRHAARVRIPLPEGATAMQVSAGPRVRLVGARLDRFRPIAAQSKQRAGQGRAARRHVTVIVPAYGDLAATETCFRTLLADAPVTLARTIVAIDDASPDPGIAALLDDLAAQGAVRLIRNRINLGFIGSVNRALATVPEGDVLLLNADTVLPAGFLDRLAAAAHSAPDIGTVVPLSNNGEASSFPQGFVENPLPDEDTIWALDAIAARVNAGVIVDIPSGTGFCLYLRRECLDLCPGLTGDLERGYLEDVEFCFRAKAHGFRSVCAANVYVGHSGTRSFGEEKRLLVARNARRLEATYPNHRQDYRDFMARDPFREVRAAIERVALDRERFDGLVLAGPSTDGAVVDDRLRRHAEEGRRMLLARFGPDGREIDLRATAGIPQNLHLPIGTPEEVREVAGRFARMDLKRIEILGPDTLPLDWMALYPHDVPCDVVVTDGSVQPVKDDTVSRIEGWAAPARQILEQDQAAKRWLEAWVPAVLPKSAVEPGQTAAAAPRPGPIALIPLSRSEKTLALIRELFGILRSGDPGTAMLVLGRTTDDLGILQSGDVFVLGWVEPCELSSVLKLYRPETVVLVSAEPIFGHPLTQAAARSGWRVVTVTAADANCLQVVQRASRWSVI